MTRFLRRFFGGGDEFESEIADHLNLLTERLIAQGMSVEEARFAARRQFGNLALQREDRRKIQTFAAIDAISRDLRYATRMLRRNPAFTAAVVLTLALGIGATTAIFSVYDAVLLKPLPYGNAHRILTLWEQSHGKDPGGVAPANFVDWRAQAVSFDEMAAVQFPGFVLTGHGEAMRLTGAAVSWNFFRLLGTHMYLGRNFNEEEDHPGRNQVAVLSYITWLHRFAGRRDVIGSAAALNDLSYTIVGVLSPDFELVTRPSQDQPELWTPLALNLEKLQRGTHPLQVLGRLKPNITAGQAQADLDVVAANLARFYPADNKDKRIAAFPVAERATRRFHTALTVLLGGVGLLLLIACANVANLLLSRAAARQKEMAVRLALGAGRGRLGQQMLTESILLSLLGGATGLLLACTAVRVMSGWLPADLPRLSRLAVDYRVLAFTAMVSILTGVLFGLAPLFHTRRDANEALKETARLDGGIRYRLRGALVAGQIAIALVLLTGAALTAQSFWKLLQVSPGFRTDHIMTARISLPASRYPDARRIAALQSDLVDRIHNLPGIQSAGMTAYLPLSGNDNAWSFTIFGRPPLPVGVYNMTKYRPVSPGYFETLGIPVRRGRSFSSADSVNSPLVVIINESMARLYWKDENPVGKQMRFERPDPRTIVGVVGDVRHEGLDTETKAEMYVPFAQIPNPERQPALVVRTSMAPSSVAPALRSALSAIDRDLPLDQIQAMDQIVAASVGQPRFRTILLVAFSLLALLIASIGVYGVMSYLVSLQTREFGIRVALGATQGNILGHVLRQASVLITAGVALGLLGSALFARLLTGLLYDVSPWDLRIFAGVSVLLSAAVLLASYLPGRRATKVDPLTALRCE